MKVLHVFMSNSSIYTPNTVKMIISSPCFDRQTHIFAVPSKDGLEALSCSLVVDKSLFGDNSLKMLKSLGAGCDIVVIHALTFTLRQMLHYPLWLAKRTVWCVWGHDFYYKKITAPQAGIKDNIYKLIKNTLFNLIEAPRVRRFKAVAVGFMPDAEKIKKIYGNCVNIIQMPYCCGYDINDIPFEKRTDNKRLKIMVGHCAFAHLNHIDVLKKLKRLSGTELCVSIPLAYGEADCQRSVAAYAQNSFMADSLEIIDGMLSSSEYVNFLKSVDIAIFDTQLQSGLANIYLLLAMGKKVYLNGDMYKGFKAMGAQVFNANELEGISIGALKDYSAITVKNRECVLPMLDSSVVLHMWEYYFSKWEAQADE